MKKLVVALATAALFLLVGCGPMDHSHCRHTKMENEQRARAVYQADRDDYDPMEPGEPLSPFNPANPASPIYGPGTDFGMWD
jgi:hypothetical protein